jgi:uncharacterized tellurite resistance protein B-like protein
MSILEKSGEKFNPGTLKNEQIEEIRELFQIALTDGRLSTKELARIQFFYYDSELSVEDFSVIKDNIFQQAVQAALDDHHITEQEQKSIFRIAKQLGVSPECMVWAHQQIESNGA